MSEFSKFIPSTEEDEKHILSYIIKHPEEHYLIGIDDLTQPNTKEVYNAVCDCYLNLDIKLFDRRVIQRHCPSVPLDYVNSILEKQNFDKNLIKSCIKNIKDYKVKLQIGDTVEKFLIQTTSKGELNYDTIRGLADNILYNSIKLDDDKTVRTNIDLVQSYREVLKKREEGSNKRSYGYKSIDLMLIRPAAQGEMTTVFGMKGSGKSLLVKGMENMLVNKGTCVISINLEMIEESNMDRLISMETNLSLEEILSDNKSEEIKQIIEENLKLRESRLNYAYYAEPMITLNELDAYIYKCKQKFKESGVLPDDGYCFITIDLTEQIEELSGKAGTELKPGVNRLLQICKKHNVHMLHVLQSNENLFRGGKMFSAPEMCDTFSLQPEMVEGGSVYAARSRVVMAVNRPLTLKRRFFPQREEEWDLETDIVYASIVKQNDSPKLSRAPFCFGDNSFRLYPYKGNTN
jgi:replicative DNA helicase